MRNLGTVVSSLDTCSSTRPKHVGHLLDTRLPTYLTRRGISSLVVEFVEQVLIDWIAEKNIVDQRISFEETAEVRSGDLLFETTQTPQHILLRREL